MSARHWALIVLLGGIWGSSFLFNAIMIRELGPIWVSAIRVLTGALGSWVVLAALKKRLPRDPVVYAQLVFVGILTYAIPFALFPLAQQHLAAGVAAIVNALTPIMTVIVAHVWVGGERATRQKALGILAGFAGVIVLSWPAVQRGGTTELWAVGACVLATLCYAVSLNYTKHVREKDPTVVATLALSAGGLAAAGAALVTEGVPHIARPETVLAALAIGLVATTFAFQMMYRLLPKVGPTNFSVTTFIAPISAIVLGALILGQSLEWAHLIGMAGIFAGLLLIDGRAVRALGKLAGLRVTKAGHAPTDDHQA